MQKTGIGGGIRTLIRCTGNAMKKESSYHHILKYTGLFGGVQVLNILMGLVRNKVIAILLGPQGLGLITIYNTAVSFLHNSTNFGLQMSGVREISRAYDEGDEREVCRLVSLLRSWSLVAALLGFTAGLTLSGLLSQWAFSSYEYTMQFASLSVVLAMTAITGGETAILKATRRLKDLARTSILGVLSALLISIPLFIVWSYDAIIPSIILIGMVQMVLVVSFSYRYYRPELLKGWGRLMEGKKMIAVGTAFVLSGAMGSGADFAVRAYLSDMSVSLAGLFNTGYMLTMTYAGMVFAAMETDYYPHLSAVCHDVEKMNGAVNRQIEVSLMMIAPLLVALMFGLQVLVPLLFSGKFLPVVGMTQIAVMAMYVRAMSLPVAYILLAKGDSRAYLLTEMVYDVLIVVTVIFGYTNWGLEGTGIALVVTSFLHCVCVSMYGILRFGLEFKSSLMKNFLFQMLLGLVSLFAVRHTEGVAYILSAAFLFLCSAGLSWGMYRRLFRRNG